LQVSYYYSIDLYQHYIKKHHWILWHLFWRSLWWCEIHVYQLIIFAIGWWCIQRWELQLRSGWWNQHCWHWGVCDLRWRWSLWQCQCARRFIHPHGSNLNLLAWNNGREHYWMWWRCKHQIVWPCNIIF
jgi:hypothetical protein